MWGALALAIGVPLLALGVFWFVMPAAAELRVRVAGFAVTLAGVVLVERSGACLAVEPYGRMRRVGGSVAPIMRSRHRRAAIIVTGGGSISVTATRPRLPFRPVPTRR